MIKKVGLLCVLLSLGLQGCDAWTQKEFRFRGIYVAEKSGYRLEIISQGIRDIGEQSVIDIHRFVQICPIQPNPRKELRFRITSHRSLPADLLVGEDASFPATAWDWRSSQRVLRQMLTQAGFESLDPTEFEGIVNVLESAPPVYEGQVKGLTVKQADWKGDYKFDRTQPQSKWIDRSELPPCS